MASVSDTLKKYPCLKSLLMDGSDDIFSSEKINKVMGYEMVRSEDILSSDVMNKVIERMVI